MDHSGAVVGPIAATAFLWFFPDQYRTLFALTFIPGALAVLMLLFVKDTRVKGTVPFTGSSRENRAGSAALARATPPNDPPDTPNVPQLRRFLVILGIFTLGNSTDAFLLLHLANAGLPIAMLPLAWSALHVVKASLSTLGGRLSDRAGRVRLIAGGWVLYAVVYAGLAFSDTLTALLTWFLVYGVYFALTEGSEKALIADLTPPALRGTAFGWYNAVLGIGALGASIGFGAVWEAFGPRAAFLSGATIALAAAAALLMARLTPSSSPSASRS